MTVVDDVETVRRRLGPANPVPDATVSPSQVGDGLAAVHHLRESAGVTGGRPSFPVPRGRPSFTVPRGRPSFTVRRKVRIRLVAAAVIAAAVIAGGLIVRGGGDGDGRIGQPPSSVVGPADVALVAATATEEAGTARARFSLTSDGFTVSGEGMGSFATGEATGTVTLPASPEAVPFVSTGQQVFVQVPETLRPFTGDRPWVQLEADLMALGNRALDDLGLSQPFDPRTVLAYVRGVSGEVTEVGPATLRGVATTHYRARIELARVAEQASAEARDELQAAADREPSIPAELWIDADGRLRQLTMSLSSPTRVDVTFELWDFGTAVDAAPPPSDQVADVGEALSGLFTPDDDAG